MQLIVDCYRSNHDDRNCTIKTFEINDMTNLERIGEIHLNVWNILQRHVLCQAWFRSHNPTNCKTILNYQSQLTK